MDKELQHIMPLRMRSKMEQYLARSDLEEIRVRIGQPMELRFSDRQIFLTEETDEQDIEEMLTFISQYSLYAYEEEVRQGFLTIAGGHRIGIVGQARVKEGRIEQLIHIRFLNIRVAHEKKGCAKTLIPFITDGETYRNTLLVSPPAVGKTTLLRDCIRLLSGGTDTHGYKICVIDERSEIAACHFGIPQNDLGKRTDVLDGCPKAEGMFLALRSMSPEILAVDELGGKEDEEVLRQAARSGCHILGTMHGKDLNDIRRKTSFQEDGLFERYIILEKQKNGNRNFTVFDQEYRKLC